MEAVGAFQSQLSSVMETVFKAAMFEITRLVEDSFVEEVRRSRRQVDSLRERLRRRDTRLPGRCADCSRPVTSPPRTPEHTERNLKQEVEPRAGSEGESDAPVTDKDGPRHTLQHSLETLLKEESLQVSLKDDQSQSWSTAFHGAESSCLQAPSDAHSDAHSDPVTVTPALTWDASFTQRVDIPPDSLCHSRYGLEELSAACHKAGPEGSSMPADLDGMQIHTAEYGDVEVGAEFGRFPQTPQIAHGAVNPSVADGLACSLACDPYSQQRFQHLPTGRGDGRHCAAGVSFKAHRQRPPAGCSQRGKMAAQAAQLRLQLRTHPPQGFSSSAELRAHKCSQNGDKPYCCTICGNKFSRLWNLKLHRRIHTQEKPHQCTMCEKSFTRADILKVHQRTHTGERPYCCTTCSLSFKRLDHLKTHQRKHTTG